MIDLVKKAMMFAMEHHANQFRNGNILPYIVHPIDVFSIVRKYKESKSISNLLSASLLHDTLEDCKTVSYEMLVLEFNKEIADLVLEMTDDNNEKSRLGKEEYQKQKLLKISSYALTLKFADFLSNCTDSPTIKMINRIHNVCKFVEQNRKLSNTQLLILKEIYRVVEEFKSNNLII